MVTQGYTATLVAATLAISRSSLYYQKRREAVGLTALTTNTSWWHAGKNPRTDIVVWLGGCEEKKTSGESQACAASDA